MLRMPIDTSVLTCRKYKLILANAKLRQLHIIVARLGSQRKEVVSYCDNCKSDCPPSEISWEGHNCIKTRTTNSDIQLIYSCYFCGFYAATSEDIRSHFKRQCSTRRTSPRFFDQKKSLKRKEWLPKWDTNQMTPERRKRKDRNTRK